MSAVSALVKTVSGLFLGILAVFRRLLCFLHLTRRRKNSGSLLPMTSTQTMDSNQTMQSIPSNDLELESWDSWGNEPSGFGQSLGTTQNHNHMNNQVNGLRRSQSQESEPEPEPDFFQDMVPTVKRPAKILVRKKEELPTNFTSKRLAMGSVMPQQIAGSELGQWDDSESAWSQEAMEDLSGQAEDALKETKHAERIRRQAEQQQKRQQKDVDRKQRRDNHFSAVKLS